MFEPFKNKSKENNPIEDVPYVVRLLGYDLIRESEKDEEIEFSSGYSVVQTASHISFTTLSQDIKKAVPSWNRSAAGART